VIYCAMMVLHLPQTCICPPLIRMNMGAIKTIIMSWFWHTVLCFKQEDWGFPKQRPVQESFLWKFTLEQTFNSIKPHGGTASSFHQRFIHYGAWAKAIIHVNALAWFLFVCTKFIIYNRCIFQALKWVGVCNKRKSNLLWIHMMRYYQYHCCRCPIWNYVEYRQARSQGGVQHSQNPCGRA